MKGTTGALATISKISVLLKPNITLGLRIRSQSGLMVRNQSGYLFGDLQLLQCYMDFLFQQLNEWTVIVIWQLVCVYLVVLQWSNDFLCHKQLAVVLLAALMCRLQTTKIRTILKCPFPDHVLCGCLSHIKRYYLQVYILTLSFIEQYQEQIICTEKVLGLEF